MLNYMYMVGHFVATFHNGDAALSIIFSLQCDAGRPLFLRRRLSEWFLATTHLSIYPTPFSQPNPLSLPLSIKISLHFFYWIVFFCWKSLLLTLFFGPRALTINAICTWALNRMMKWLLSLNQFHEFVDYGRRTVQIVLTEIIGYYWINL